MNDRQGTGATAGPARRPLWRRVLHWILMVLSAIVLIGAAVFTVAYLLTPGPGRLQPQGDAAVSASQISYADGSKAATTGVVNRTRVEREDIPETLINGVLGAEQHDFYRTPGVSISGTTRALLTGGEAGGGSTITQQMARNYYDGLSQERSYTRKIKEIFISLKVAERLTPDDIITQYLNTIYFGRNAYGVQEAAQAYFGKDVGRLNAAEGAYIGALIQQPSTFADPAPDSPEAEALRARWDYTVRGAVRVQQVDPEHGMSAAEAQELEFPEAVEWTGGDGMPPLEAYIRDAVVRELVDRYDLTDQQIATGGYEIETSLDADLMQAARTAFTDTLGEDLPEQTVRGLAAVEPGTGEIRAFHGGTDPVTDTDNSLIQRAQAGSAFKPYALAAGLADGRSLNSVYDGSSPQSFPGLTAQVRNNDGTDYGPVTLLEATENSVNTAYVGLTVDIGPEKVRDTAAAAGIPEEQFETAGLGPNIALGTYQVTALDQASGFSTFANEGVHMPRHMITAVSGDDGELTPNDAEELDEGTRAFGRDVAADASYAMQQVVDGGTGSSAQLDDGRPVAGKTGTTDSATAAWFAGSTPQLSVAVGLSRSDGQPLSLPGMGDVYGGSTSALIWKDFMEQAMEGEPVERFPEPAWGGNENDGGAGMDGGQQEPIPEETASEPAVEPEESPQDEPEEEPEQTQEPTGDGGEDGGQDPSAPGPGGTESPGGGGDGGDGGDGGTEDGGGDGTDQGDGAGDGIAGGGTAPD